MNYIEYNIDEMINSRIRVLEKISSGGFGLLYMGYDVESHRKVIVKTVNRDFWIKYGMDKMQHLSVFENIKKRVSSLSGNLNTGEYIYYTFFREAVISMQLQGHPGFPAGLSFWVSPLGQPFFEVEKIEGKNLDAFFNTLGQKKLPVLESLHIAISVCNTLIYFFRTVIKKYNNNHPYDKVTGFVHRDIKPANIIITDNNEVKLIDYGNAKFISEFNATIILGLTNIVVASQPYAPPEQLINFDTVDHQGDIYSLGATLYFLLSGNHKPLFNRVPGYRVPEINSQPPDLNRILLKCLEYNPPDRYQSFDDLKKDLIALILKIKDRTAMIPDNAKCTKCGYPDQVFTAAVSSPGFVRIPAGSFIKGCPIVHFNAIHILFSGFYKDPDFLKSFPEHSEKTSAYEISVNPVTNSEYYSFLRKSGYDGFPGHWKRNVDPPFDQSEGDLPVVNVSYMDALRFCDQYHFRLPTGDEWERAARGDKGNLYPWGDKFNISNCNGAESNLDNIVSVHNYPLFKSPYGCNQMAGNVAEWIDESNSYKNVVGGSFGDSCRIFGLPFLRRLSLSTDQHEDYIGFRVVKGANAFKEHQNPSIEFVMVPQGGFIKGCPGVFYDELNRDFRKLFKNPDYLNSFPEQKVYTDSYEISVTTITNEQYAAFLQESDYPNYPSHWDKQKRFPYGHSASHIPVVNISYDDAVAFCKFYGLRIPSGNEWEKAARGTEGLLYPWGNQYNKDACNGAESGIEETLDVHSYLTFKSPFGCLQMVGNVAEWIDESDTQSANYKFVAGGSFRECCEVRGLSFLRDRSLGVNEKRDYVGFRVVREIQNQKPADKNQNLIKCPLCGGEFIDFDIGEIDVPKENLIWGGFF